MRLFNLTINELFQQRTRIRMQPAIEIQQLEGFPSRYLKRKVRIDVYLPPGHYSEPAAAGYPFVIFNDGQDLEAVRLIPTLGKLWRMGRLPHLITVGIHAADRMQEYGTAHRADYQQRGSRAEAYAHFVTEELLPALRQRYHLSTEIDDAAIAGFSLGGLSALDIAWQYPLLFGKVGIFSGSLWWRSEVFDPADPDANRIAHHMIAKGPIRENMKFWLQAGTLDETEDRNNNGIIDSIDDTLDLIMELRELGYEPGTDMRYVEVEGGKHEPGTWGKVMPDFLQWVFS